MLLYNGKHYKQLHSTAMGSPVSVFVAEVVIMQNNNEQPLATYTIVNYSFLVMLLLYVDDKEVMDNFHGHVNRQFADVQFTRKIEETG